MKKRSLILSIIILVSILTILTIADTIVSADTCENEGALTCGTTPNSATGYGAVDICGECHVCGVKDNICPEDFYSTSSKTRGNCRNCPDPDCTATVHGWVSTEFNPAPNAKVYVTYGNGQTLIATTNGNGYYESNTSSAGNVKFHAIKSDYDSEIVSRSLVRGSSSNEVNISISPGACNENCTDTYGNICKAKCDGLNGCHFTDPSTINPMLYTQTSNNIASRCDGYAPGTRFPIFENATSIDYAECCNGGVIKESRPELNILQESQNDCIRNLGTSVITAKYKGSQVKIVVKAWEPEPSCS